MALPHLHYQRELLPGAVEFGIHELQKGSGLQWTSSPRGSSLQPIQTLVGNLPGEHPKNADVPSSARGVPETTPSRTSYEVRGSFPRASPNLVRYMSPPSAVLRCTYTTPRIFRRVSGCFRSAAYGPSAMSPTIALKWSQCRTASFYRTSSCAAHQLRPGL
jgi:hypothetical protein